MADLNNLFCPRGIAIIGASNRPFTIGHRIMANLQAYGFKGPITPVNPKGGEILGVMVARSIKEVQHDVDLAHVIVRNTLVAQTLRDCAEKGVKVCIINTSGFKELNQEGAKMEREIVEIARELGIRLLGPNCQGVMNTDLEVNLYSNFTFAKMTPGHVSMVCQGGGVAEVINNYFGMNHIGQRMYASPGNACDISIPEILEFYGDDPGTHVIVLHLESFADPQEFLDKVPAITAKKPVLALKSGTTPEGARAVSSHTGGLMEQDTVTDVLFDKCGVLRFANLGELCDTAAAFATQPVPRGDRVGMVTNAGSPAIIVTDGAVKAGLKVPDLSESSKEFLREKLSAIASIANPIDMMATAAEAEFGASLKILVEDANLDSVVVCFMTPFFVDTLGIAKAVETYAAQTDRTLIAVAMTDPGGKAEWRETVEKVRKAGLPVYYFPEDAARVLYHMNRFRALRDRPREAPPRLAVDKNAARGLIQGAQRSPDGFISPEDAGAILKAYGINMVAEHRGGTFNDLKAAAAKIGYPVVLKAEAPTLVHKTESFAVILNIKDEAELKKAFDDLYARLRGVLDLSYLLQNQLIGGLEVIVGGARASKLGSMIMFGLGGVNVEIFKDVVFKLAPLCRSEAEEMLAEIRSSTLLDGFRGQPAVDRGALVEILLKVSVLLHDHPEIEELDLNPVMAFPEGRSSVVVDARIKLGK
jgi:acetyltransferase